MCSTTALNCLRIPLFWSPCWAIMAATWVVGQPAVGINDPFIELEFSDLTVGIHSHFTHHGESIHLGIQRTESVESFSGNIGTTCWGKYTELPRK